MQNTEVRIQQDTFGFLNLYITQAAENRQHQTSLFVNTGIISENQWQTWKQYTHAKRMDDKKTGMNHASLCSGTLEIEAGEEAGMVL